MQRRETPAIPTAQTACTRISLPIRPTTDGRSHKAQSGTIRSIPSPNRHQIRFRRQSRRTTHKPAPTTVDSTDTRTPARPPSPRAVILKPAPIVIRRPAPRLSRNPRPSPIRLPNPVARAIRSPARRNIREPCRTVIRHVLPVAAAVQILRAGVIVIGVAAPSRSRIM